MNGRRTADTMAMQRYKKRLTSFATWPPDAKVSPEQLARNGFYYFGNGDTVRCAFCKVEIMRWMEGDDVATDHARWAPQCPFVKNLREWNEMNVDMPFHMMESSDSESDLDSNADPDSNTDNESYGYDECGWHEDNDDDDDDDDDTFPLHKGLVDLQARIDSFAGRWPENRRPTPWQLADAGFFYAGPGDRVMCFYYNCSMCAGGPDQEPWYEHARWFPSCPYVQKVKGKEFVQSVMSDACTIKQPATPWAPATDTLSFVAAASAATTSATPLTAPLAALSVTESAAKSVTESLNNDNDSGDALQCKICYEHKCDTCFLPCGHVVACYSCALAVFVCPLCRQNYCKVQKLFYA
ncbi:iap-3 [Peridroma alphabaculovirus]|uniref:Iap-3 n=1 Tax=Peridroma alphabaculovirus TaxID=1346829 RepID=A0A068LKG3_9ABAC|nr:iap-3 [Peridroma alphabaculovirus]AIE47772.1 iap-3 [Peridroma alphabaculovirus]